MMRSRRRPRRLRLTCAAAVAALAAMTLTVAAPAPAHADQVRSLEYWLSGYGIADAWQTTRGAGITVAVIDTGVDGSVAELRGAVTGGADFSGQGAANGQKPVGADSDHGTWVASLLAGRGTGAGNGVIGVAPEASILSLSVGLGGQAASSSDEQIPDAVRWAVDHGASVINMSLTRNTLDWPESWDSAFQYAFAHNVVVVAAAGNRGSGTTEVGAPATIPGVLTVAGVDRAGRASFDASSQGITIGVSAPSEQLVGVSPGGGYVQWEGTSGAAPIVAGVVALVQASHPGLSAANVINRIIRTARPVGSAPSPIYGYGLLDARAAVTAAVPSVTANPMGDLGEWIRVHRRAEATDAPTPGATAAPTATPTALAPEPVDTAAFLMPRWGTVTGVIIPVTVLLAFVAIAALGGVAAWRHFRRLRQKG